MIRQEKTRKDMLIWKDQNNTADKSDNATLSDKSRDINERMETCITARRDQVMQSK